MFCKYCGKQIKDDDKFCKYCGKQIKGAETITQTEIKNTCDNSAENSEKKYDQEIKETKTQKNNEQIYVILPLCILTIALIVITFLVNKTDTNFKSTNNIECKNLSDKIGSSIIYKSKNDIDYNEMEKLINQYYDKKCNTGSMLDMNDKWSALSLNARHFSDKAKEIGDKTTYIEQLKKVAEYKSKSNMDDKDFIVGYAYVDLGKAYYEQKQYKNSIKAYEEALPYYKNLGNKPILLPEFIANSYLALNEHDKAKDYYMEAIENIEKEYSNLNNNSNKNNHEKRTLERDYNRITTKISDIQEKYFSDNTEQETAQSEQDTYTHQEESSLKETEAKQDIAQEEQIDWSSYMTKLEKQIKKNWKPPKENTSTKVLLLFKIGRDGNIISIKTLKNSGSLEDEKAAIEALKLSAPFNPLPSEYKKDSIDIEFSFDYNVTNSKSYK